MTKICLKFASHHFLLYALPKIIEFCLRIQMLPAKM